MTRPAVAVALPHDEYLAVSAPLAEAGYEPVEIASSRDLERALRREDVGLAVLDGESDVDRTLEMYGILRDREREIPALVAVSPTTIDTMRLAGQAYAGDEYFTRPYSAESLRWRVEAMLIRSETLGLRVSEPILQTRLKTRSSVPLHRGQVVVVFNPKGGVGKTTIAVNLAAALEKRKGEKVLLVDCDTVTGHVAESLGMSGIRTVVEAWTQDFRSGNNEQLVDIATPHDSGVAVLTMAESPLHTTVLEPRRVVESVSAARHDFDWIIVDLHPDYGPLNQGIFERADRILVPVTPDLPTIRAAIQFMHIAEELNFRDRLSLVVNRVNSGVSVRDIEKTIGLPVYARIRSAGMLFVRASNEGLSAVERFPGERVIGDIEALAGRLLHDTGNVDAAGARTRQRWTRGRLPSFVSMLRARFSGRGPSAPGAAEASEATTPATEPPSGPGASR